MRSTNLIKALSLIAKSGIFILLVYLIFHQINFADFKKNLLSINLKYFLIALLFQYLCTACSGLRSKLYHQYYGLNLNFTFMQMLYFAGYFFNLLLPGGVGGDAYKAIYLSKHFKFKKTLGFRLQLYERTSGFYAMCLLAFLVCMFTNFIDHPFILAINFTLLSLLTPLYLFGSKYILKDDLHIVKNIVPISLLGQTIQVIAAIMLCYSVDINMDAKTMANFIFLYAAGTIAATFPISIGGVGIREFVILYGVKFINHPELEALSVAYAFLAYILLTIIGFSGLPAYLLLNKAKASCTR